MASAAAPSSVLAAQARRLYCDQVSRALGRTVRNVIDRLREQCTQVSPPDVTLRRRDLLVDLPRQSAAWQQSFAAFLAAVLAGHPAPTHGARPTATRAGELALVDDSTIDLEILVSRMALAMMDKASWEFSDLRFRMGSLDRRDEMDPHDVLRPHALARAAVDSWRTVGLSVDHWKLVQALLHEEFAALVHEAYHETNRWLIGQGCVLKSICASSSGAAAMSDRLPPSRLQAAVAVVAAVVVHRPAHAPHPEVRRVVVGAAQGVAVMPHRSCRGARGSLRRRVCSRAWSRACVPGRRRGLPGHDA